MKEVIMSNQKFEFSFVSSLEKIFFQKPDASLTVTGSSMLKNEIHSFQLAAWAEGDVPQRIPCSIEINSEISEYVSVFAVDYVPGLLPLLYGEWKGDHDFLTMEPGLFPDPLRRVRDGRIELSNSQSRALWFSVEPKGKVSGCYPITVTIKRDNGETIGELTYRLEIINAELPALDIVNTGWFHGDCLSVLHDAPVFSEKYWEVVAKYLEIYTKFGHNMVLTPVFTPPLDAWANEWQARDNALYEKFIPEDVEDFKDHIYCKNILRFMGRSDEDPVRKIPMVAE